MDGVCVQNENAREVVVLMLYSNITIVKNPLTIETLAPHSKVFSVRRGFQPYINRFNEIGPRA